MEHLLPRLTKILETVLYFADQDRTERFYVDVLGMRLLSREPGHSLQGGGTLASTDLQVEGVPGTSGSNGFPAPVGSVPGDQRMMPVWPSE